MTIRCPHCGRDGRLPDKLAAQRQILRCRKCRGRFRSEAQLGAPVVPHLEPSEMTGELAQFPATAALLASLDDENDLPATLTDLGDSNYELTVSLEGELDDSQFELPTIKEPHPSPSEDPPAPALVLAGPEPEPLPPDPQYYNLIDSWSRICFWGVLGLGGLALVVIGVFLVRAFLGRPNLNSSITALILGFVGTIAFLLISCMTVALNLLLVDLARNTRRLRLHADRSAQIASK
jgi:zinc-ribbon domain